jgi:putative DNA primase/helicase
MSESKKPFHEAVAERLIAQLKAGTAPLQRPWAPGEPGGVLPLNPTTGKRYKGINAIHLMSQGRTDHRWMTYRQAAAAGAQVRKGEKGTPVQYWKFSEEQAMRDERGQPVRDGEGTPLKVTVMLERPRVFFATVFNAEQIDGLPPLAHKPPAWDALERAEHILVASGAVIRHGEANRAFYRRATDSIHLPDKGQFPSAAHYYATALHELGHWTGHAVRLDRDLTHPFGSEGYAREELRAEIASMILGDELGIGYDPGQHAAYVGSWIKALEEDPLEIFRAAAEAEKIKDYVMAFEQTQVQAHGQAQEQDAQPLPTVAERTAPQYEAMKAADEAFQAELVRAYGENAAGDRRYQPIHDDPAVHAAADAFKAAADAWRAAVADARQTMAERDPMQQAIPTQEVSMQTGPADVASDVAPDVTQGAADQAAQAVEAEAWTLDQAARGTLPHALASARLAQIDQSLERLDHMQPLNTQNAFWARHALPEDVDALEARIQVAIESLEPLREEARVAAARKAGDMAAFDAAAREAFDIALPHDWNGHVQVQASAEVTFNGATHVVAAADLGVEPQLWSVYAQRGDGGFVFVQDFGRARQAEHLAYRLAVVAANSTDNEHERAAILARAHEDRVRRDPGSTDEDVSAAKAARKAAELSATLHDADLQKRIGELEAQQEQAADRPAQDERTYLAVPYKEKDAAKALGARWDRKEQSWYIPPGVDAAPFAPWAPRATPAPARTAENPGARQTAAQARVYLAVPYGERSAARAAGALWDTAAKSWYAGPKADRERLQRWLPDNVPAQQAPAMSPREEFAEALRAIGAIVTGEHPIMDGAKHRIGVEGDKRGEQAGFYVAHLDGHPAGYIKNNRTGVEMTWKSKGYALDPQEKARWAAEAAEKLAARAQEQERLHEATAQRVVKQMAELVPVIERTPYLRDKGIQAHAGILTDKDRQTTYLPAFDVDGKQWTMQYISQDGTKRFAKDSRKEGCFHPVGGMEALARAPALVISEGYATAATNAEVLRFATVAAFDSGNLAAVAQALHEKFPDKPVLILGDDDRQLELTQGVNAGRVKAQEAAKAVGGAALFPIFAPGENAYPADLAPVTPQSYRAHLRATKALEDAQKDSEGATFTEPQAAALKGAQLSAAQLAALEQMKAHTDFNDLATRSVLGREGVERQVKAEIGRVIREAEVRRERIQAQQSPEQQTRRAARIA